MPSSTTPGSNPKATSTLKSSVCHPPHLHAFPSTPILMKIPNRPRHLPPLGPNPDLHNPRRPPRRILRTHSIPHLPPHHRALPLRAPHSLGHPHPYAQNRPRQNHHLRDRQTAFRRARRDRLRNLLHALVLRRSRARLRHDQLLRRAGPSHHDDQAAHRRSGSSSTVELPCGDGAEESRGGDRGGVYDDCEAVSGESCVCVGDCGVSYAGGVPGGGGECVDDGYGEYAFVE